MSDLVERYVHQVGRYLPQNERAEIEAELRSQIHDQLDDRYNGSPTPDNVATVLAELGDPRQMAASYGSQQYLVGPDLYPSMMRVLRLGWVRVPLVVVVLNIVWTLINSQEGTLFGLFFETLTATLYATFVFSAFTVITFAIMQHSNVELDKKKPTFDPSDLPPVDDPGAIDYVEMTFGLAFGVFAMFIFLYFLYIGGLTLRFNLSDPGKIIAVPHEWLILLVANSSALTLLNLFALWRNHWTALTWSIQLVIEVLGVVCLYYVLYKPLLDPAESSALEHVPLIGLLPELVAISTGAIMLLSEGPTLFKLMTYQNNPTSPAAAKV